MKRKRGIRAALHLGIEEGVKAYVLYRLARAEEKEEQDLKAGPSDPITIIFPGAKQFLELDSTLGKIKLGV